MAPVDFDKPVTTDQYTALLAEVRAMQAAIATLLDSRGDGGTNLPDNAKRWNDSLALFQSWEGSAWANKVLSIAGGGTGANTAAGARAALGTNDANNINAGTLNSARLPTVPVTKGGTGQTMLTSGSYLVGNGTGNVAMKTVAEVKTDLGLGSAAYVGTSYFTLASHGAASSGVHGITGDVVGTNDVQVLENKELIAPVIDSFENAQHSHSDAESGGLLSPLSAFSVHRGGGNQSISASTWTKVAFTTEEFDVKGDFDIATYRFTPTVAGKYTLTASVRFTTPTNGDGYIAIYKNGTEYKQTTFGETSEEGEGIAVLVDANGSTDYFEVYVYFSSGVTLSGATSHTWFQGARLG